MKPTPEQVTAEVIAALPAKFDWFYRDQGDRLYEQQIARVLDEGDEGMLAIEETIQENLLDYRWTQESEAINEAFKDAGHENHRDLISERQEEEIREALYERDEADPAGELLSATPDMFFRYVVDLDIDTRWNSTEDEYEEQMAAIAEALGIDLDTNRAALTDMLINASDGGTLCVFWRGDVESMVRAAADFGSAPASRTISWTNPSLLVLDAMNGSGFECEVVGTITLDYDRENMRLDAKGCGHGYSWNEVTGGLVGQAYDNEPTIAEKVNADA